MNLPAAPQPSRRDLRYIPLIQCAEFDSPIDALVGMHVAHDEAMELVAAAWHGAAIPDGACVLGAVDGGRGVAALRLASGRWAGCNAFPEHASALRGDAERQLRKILRRGRRGYVVALPEAWLAR